jgi:hypothetical protein
VRASRSTATAVGADTCVICVRRGGWRGQPSYYRVGACEGTGASVKRSMVHA